MEGHKDSAKHVRGGNKPHLHVVLPLNFILTSIALRTRYFLNPSDAPLTNLLDTLSLDSLTLKDAIGGQLLLRELKATDEYMKDYNQKAANRFPDAAAFGGKVE